MNQSEARCGVDEAEDERDDPRESPARSAELSLSKTLYPCPHQELPYCCFFYGDQ